MSDISKVQVSEDLYDIKDNSARQSINSHSSSILDLTTRVEALEEGLPSSSGEYYAKKVNNISADANNNITIAASDIGAASSNEMVELSGKFNTHIEQLANPQDLGHVTLSDVIDYETDPGEEPSNNGESASLYAIQKMGYEISSKIGAADKCIQYINGKSPAGASHAVVLNSSDIPYETAGGDSIKDKLDKNSIEANPDITEVVVSDLNNIKIGDNYYHIAGGGGSESAIQVEELPTPSAEYENKIYQYIGESDIYTNGYFYKCQLVENTTTVKYFIDNEGIVCVKEGSVSGDCIYSAKLDTSGSAAMNYQPAFTPYNRTYWINANSKSYSLEGEDGDGAYDITLINDFQEGQQNSANLKVVLYPDNINVNTTVSYNFSNGNSAEHEESSGTFYDWVRVNVQPSGGEGGTADYTELENKPSINNVELDGNKSLTDLGVAAASHTHTKSNITDFTHTHTKNEITDFNHSHNKSDITDFPTDISIFNNDVGYITADKIKTIQVKELPEPSESLKDTIYQYIGETTDNYKNGYFYKCNATGEVEEVNWYGYGNATVVETSCTFYGKDNAIPIAGSRVYKGKSTVSFANIPTFYPFDGTYHLRPDANCTEDLNITFEKDGAVWCVKGTKYTKSGDTWTTSSYMVNILKFTNDDTTTQEPSLSWDNIKVQPGGGEGGTSDYEELENLPKINGVTLTGNKTTEDLNIHSGNAVSVSTEGTSTNEVKYITVDDVEYKLAGSEEGSSGTAKNISYDNEDSGLNAVNVQEAIDELSIKINSLIKASESEDTF